MEQRVIIGISAMVLLFASFLIAFIHGQRKKLQYHKDLHRLHEEQQQQLTEQNARLEDRVEERTAELRRQKEALEKSLAELKATQLQLVQKEKMASLGELTAGIAHEIQNPLNFVNNFSEVNRELLAEIKLAIASGDVQEAKALADALEENEQKVLLHGRRADAIVKGMLQHSRVNTGEREPTSLNALVNEYLQLAYQALRSRDRQFYIRLETHFDPAINRININRQDIGRVLLNIYNNALYAVKEKSAATRHDEAYEPVISIYTKKADEEIEIRIRDNGTGIPAKLKDKVYQPFFTTKPAGQGTGLGLSLSYELMRSLGGSLAFESEQGEGTEFVLRLPLTSVAAEKK